MRNLIEAATLWREVRRARRRFLRRAWIEHVIIDTLLPQLTAGLRAATPSRVTEMPPAADDE